MDSENKEALFKLLRFNSRNNGKTTFVSIDDYIKNMSKDQQKIYFIVNPSFDAALTSPYMEPFSGSKLDVIILTNNVDEILFQQMGEIAGKKFVSIESSYEEI